MTRSRTSGATAAGAQAAQLDPGVCRWCDLPVRRIKGLLWHMAAPVDGAPVEFPERFCADGRHVAELPAGPPKPATARCVCGRWVPLATWSDHWRDCSGPPPVAARKTGRARR